MAGLKPESLNWIDQLGVLRAQAPNATRSELKKVLNCRDGQITILRNLEACFDPEAQAKVRQAANGNTPFILSSNAALALAGLAKAGVADLPKTFHEALNVTLARRLKPKQIEALVKWVARGKPAETFDPKAKPEKTTVEPTYTPSKSQAYHLEQLAELVKKAEAEKARGKGETAAQETLEAYFQKMNESREGDPPVGISSPSHKTSKRGSGTEKANDNEPSLFWEWMLGVKFMNQLKSKAKKGQLTLNEKLLIVLDKVIVKPFVSLFEHLGKFAGKSIKEALHGLWHAVKEAFGKTFAKVMKYAVPILIICLLVWGAGKVYQFVVVKPLHWIESKVVSGFHWGGSKIEEPVTPAPAAPSTVLAIPAVPQAVRSAKLKTSNSSLPTHHSPPVAVYQPAVSFIPSSASTKTLYDPKILELEIAAIPKNSTIKDYVYQPDEGMPADLAVSRLQDLTDADKYTMMIGGDKQKILSFTPSNTNFIITYKSTDPFGLGGSGSMNFFWEDVLYIHSDEIDPADKTHSVIYQCSVVVKDGKYPLTLQCASSDDLENLVSSLEYFIRHSRLGHDAQPGGMPYPNQGILFNDDRVVTLLWAKSPMDKASVSLGDHLWSAGKMTPDQQSRKELEAGLRSLPATLFTASPAEWDKAQVTRQSASFNTIRPQLRKMVLQP